MIYKIITKNKKKYSFSFNYMIRMILCTRRTHNTLYEAYDKI